MILNFLKANSNQEQLNSNVTAAVYKIKQTGKIIYFNLILFLNIGF